MRSANQSSADTGRSSAAGATPTTAQDSPLIRTVSPITEGSERKVERQRRSERTTAGEAPGRASSASRLRPSSGWTCSRSKKGPFTRPARNRSAVAPWRRKETVSPQNPATPSNDFCSRLQSSMSWSLTDLSGSLCRASTVDSAKTRSTRSSGGGVMVTRRKPNITTTEAIPSDSTSVAMAKKPGARSRVRRATRRSERKLTSDPLQVWRRAAAGSSKRARRSGTRIEASSVAANTAATSR